MFREETPVNFSTPVTVLPLDFLNAKKMCRDFIISLYKTGTT